MKFRSILEEIWTKCRQNLGEFQNSIWTNSDRNQGRVGSHGMWTKFREREINLEKFKQNLEEIQTKFRMRPRKKLDKNQTKSGQPVKKLDKFRWCSECF